MNGTWISGLNEARGIIHDARACPMYGKGIFLILEMASVSVAVTTTIMIAVAIEKAV
jgi:hypothetical protein